MVDEATFTFLLTNDYYIKKYFDSWQDLIVSGDDKFIGYKESYTTDVVVQQMSSGSYSIPAYGVKLINAFPIAINSIELSNQSQNDVVKVTITLGFDDWKEESLLDSAGSLLGMGKDLLSGTVGQVKSLKSLFK